MPLGWLSVRKPSIPWYLPIPPRADAAEREIVLPDMHDRAVDGDVAGGRTVEHPAPVCVVVAEVVERERGRAFT
jgi:hypothetical protein